MNGLHNEDFSAHYRIREIGLVRRRIMHSNALESVELVCIFANSQLKVSR